MNDQVEHFHGAEIHHGDANNRVYLMKMGAAVPAELSVKLIGLARENGYTKIFAKVPESASGAFLRAGYIVEARVPRFFHGGETAFFMAFFLDDTRSVDDTDELNRVLEMALARRGQDVFKESPGRVRKCVPADIPVMAEIYRGVFPSYPFPIHDEGYLLETMAAHVAYFGVELDGRLVSISSAEKDLNDLNAEMTDFATPPDWRGNGFAVKLLSAMEDCAAAAGVCCAYTIARAVSPGMNITFAKSGYDYAGRLTKNTDISGRIESMNVWFKSICRRRGSVSQDNH